MDNKNYTEFFEDEKELLWKLRAEVRDHYPESLSKLLLITKWNKREDVLQVKIDTFTGSGSRCSGHTLCVWPKSILCLRGKKQKEGYAKLLESRFVRCYIWFWCLTPFRWWACWTSGPTCQPFTPWSCWTTVFQTQQSVRSPSDVSENSGTQTFSLWFLPLDFQLHQDFFFSFLSFCTQWWWTFTVPHSAGPGLEVWILPGLWPHYLPARESIVQQENRTLPILASKVGLEKGKGTIRRKKKNHCSILPFFACLTGNERFQVRNPRAISEFALHSDPGGLLQRKHLAHQALDQTGEATIWCEHFQANATFQFVAFVLLRWTCRTRRCSRWRPWVTLWSRAPRRWPWTGWSLASATSRTWSPCQTCCRRSTPALSWLRSGWLQTRAPIVFSLFTESQSDLWFTKAAFLFH